jgi:CspA family cold shock protein
MKKGTVKFFNPIKGYGFIVEDETLAEIFVNAADCQGVLKPNEKVQFLLKEGKKGLNAVGIRRLVTG